jgi:hypothetical protein
MSRDSSKSERTVQDRGQAPSRRAYRTPCLMKGPTLADVTSSAVASQTKF